MLWLIIGIIIFVAIAVILFIFLKKIIKVIAVLSAIIIIALLIGGFILYNDSKDLQENFENSPNLFLLELNDNIITGFQTIPGSDEPITLNKETINSYNSDYQKNNLEKIKSENYKLIIFKRQAFDSVEQIEIGDHEYTKDFVFTLINSETAVDDYIDDLVIREAVPQEQREIVRKETKSDFEFTDSEFKGILFASVFSNTMESEGPIFLFKQYKSGNAVIYKETPVFKLIDMIPTSYLQNIIKQTTSTVKEKII